MVVRPGINVCTFVVFSSLFVGVGVGVAISPATPITPGVVSGLLSLGLGETLSWL